MPLSLAIITPTFNSGGTLESTLSSIRPLVAAGAKSIVVDSGSTDKTLDIAKYFGSTLIYCAPGNMYEAINRGMDESDAEWVTYLNSDDILFVDAILNGIRMATTTTDIIYGSLDYIDRHGRFLHAWKSPSPWIARRIWPYVMPIPQVGTLIRRATLVRLGGFDTRYKYAADYDFFARASDAGFHFQNVRRPSVGAFRVHAGQISQRRAGEMGNEARDSRTRANRRKRLRHLPLFWLFRVNNFLNYTFRFVRAMQLTGQPGAQRTLTVS